MVNALRTQRPKIRASWEALLRAEPISSPLGNPDALVHLIDWTLDEIFSGFTNPLSRHRPSGNRLSAADRHECPCGRNPLLAYFAAGEQALQEALVLAQAAAAPLDPLERDASFSELTLTLHHIARREIDAFCGVCQFRPASSSVPVQLHTVSCGGFPGNPPENPVKLG
jgi:hypothetical protein